MGQTPKKHPTQMLIGPELRNLGLRKVGRARALSKAPALGVYSAGGTGRGGGEVGTDIC